MRAYLTSLIGLAATVGLSLSPEAQAQHHIPEEVIAQCNASKNAHRLPDCLRDGTLAYEMLEASKSADLYGQAASRVIDACADQNNTFNSTWLCFRIAAEKATEARSLIGVEAISDTCVAQISDPSLYEALKKKEHSLRERMLPDNRIGAFGTYKPFTGCP